MNNNTCYEEEYRCNGVSVVTTTWCEREYIEPFVKAVREALKYIPHEIIIVDDSSPDGTGEIAKLYADKVIIKKREGQTRGLATGILNSKFNCIVTIDVDLENDPKLIPNMIKLLSKYDIVVASRTYLPRFSEGLASKILGGKLHVSDVFSNFRAFRSDVARTCASRIKLRETFGAEFLVIAIKNNYKIKEIFYEPPPRRKNPRIGGKMKANLRILWAIMKILYSLMFVKY